MPNWCENCVVINDMTEELKQFLTDKGLQFEAIVYPDYPENDETGGFDRVDAQVTAWSTKWDLTEREAREAAKQLIEHGSCAFDTAWSPPENVFVGLSKLFPSDSIELHYFEPGMGFAGSLYFNGGSVTDAVNVDVHSTDEITEFLVDKMGNDPEDVADMFPKPEP